MIFSKFFIVFITMSNLNKMRKSRGRFFGLYTKNGHVINAQFRHESPNYVTVYDRNNHVERRVAKNNILAVR